MNVAPVTVTTPDGTVYQPVRAVLDEGYLSVYDRDGHMLADVPADLVTGGRRIRRVATTNGTWIVADICGCSSGKRALLAEWRGVPAREGS